MSLLSQLFGKKIDANPKLRNLKSALKNKNQLVSNYYLTNFYYRYLSIDENDIVGKMSDYGSMMRDPIISNAHELVVDDATNFSYITNKRIWSIADDEDVQKINEDLFNDLNVQELVVDVTNRIVYRGNAPLRIYYKQENCTGGISHTELEDNIFRYIPIEINGVLINWYDKYTEQMLQPYEVVFFKISKFFEFQMLDDYQSIFVNEREINKNTFKYGLSYFENCRRIWRQLKLLEDSLILTKLAISPLFRIITVECPDDTKPQDASDLIDFYASLFTSTTTLNLDDNILKNSESQVNYGTNIILPKLKGQSLTVEDKGGETDVGGLLDMDYFNKKFYASLKVPAAFLGLTDDLPGSLGESTLIRLEIRYARSVRKVQYSVTKGFKDLLYYNLLSLNNNINYEDFDVTMNMVSTAEDEEYKNALASSMDALDKFTDVLGKLQEFRTTNSVNDEDFNTLLNYISTKILNINDFDLQKFYSGVSGGGENEIPVEEGPEGTIEQNKESSEEEPKLKKGEYSSPMVSIPRKLKNPGPDKFSSKWNKHSNAYKGIHNNPKPVEVGMILSKLDYKTRRGLLKLLDNNTVRFKSDNTLKYIKEIRSNPSNKKYIAENIKKPIALKDLSKYVGKITGFDVGVFKLQYENKSIDLTQYETKYIKEKVEAEQLKFLECVYNITDVVNTKPNEIVNIFKLEGKYYINYSNSLVLFNNVITETKYSYNIVELIDRRILK